MISELNGWPACALVNASPAVLPWLAHDSGLEWFAIPFPYGSFIRYSMPVLTGAFDVPFSGLTLFRPWYLELRGIPSTGLTVSSTGLLGFGLLT
jgi:hypothetical protein